MIIIDRIVGDIAVCENGDEMVNIPISSILGKAREGDVLIEDKSKLTYTIDVFSTEQRRASINDSFSRLKARNPKNQR